MLHNKIKLPTLILATLSLAAIALLASAAIWLTTDSQEAQLSEADFSGLTDASITMYKDPSCGCCAGYAAALRRHGLEVTVEETNELEAIKAEHTIPAAGASCHTMLIDEYVVEGHVPLIALAQLLQEQPAIAGIGLGGMPLGTPGMPGTKRAPYEVYQLSETGEMSPYLSI